MLEQVIADETNGRLRSIVERIERVEEKEDAAKSDKKVIYDEAKADGYHPKIIRKIVKIRKADRAKLQEEATLTELYAAELGEVLP